MAIFEVLRKECSDYLQQCFIVSDVKTFQKKCTERCTSDSNRKAAIDQALRDTLLVILSENASINVHLLEIYITFCIELCRKDLAIACLGMPTMLLDIFDSMTLDRSEQLLTFVENNVMSRSQQTVFSGRILLFLTKYFPFSERSGFNINLAVKNQKEMILEQITKDDDKSEAKVPIDYCTENFEHFRIFLEISNQLYLKVHWKVFSIHASSVLLAFLSFKLEEQRNCPSTCRLPSPEVNDQEFNGDVLKQESEQFEVENTDMKG
ncbi:hypothetical protein E2986_08414 [Frieseomelitta varia]|uniref:Uncharacterized protein n=1 Tax=Frieseomelitta varia TaxID=561572 RepID=A0A833S2U1_9HYME|nr:hypothetical protein E2986_08414 [Frieseomelitta varia]